jgi:uncharacterized protein YecT (DUF1311 family)
VAEAVTAALGDCLAGSDSPEGDAACATQAHADCLRTGPGLDSTFGLVMCTEIEHDAWRAELDRLWPEVLAYMGRSGEEAVAALTAEQDAWTAFRDARCARVLARFLGGSIQSHIGTECRIEMLADRGIEFREILRWNP